MGWGVNSHLRALSLTSCLSLAPYLDSEAQLQNRANKICLTEVRVCVRACVCEHKAKDCK